MSSQVMVPIPHAVGTVVKRETLDGVPALPLGCFICGANCFICLCLSFLICTMGTIPSPSNCWEGSTGVYMGSTQNSAWHGVRFGYVLTVRVRLIFIIMICVIFTSGSSWKLGSTVISSFLSCFFFSHLTMLCVSYRLRKRVC